MTGGVSITPIERCCHLRKVTHSSNILLRNSQAQT
ncbi:hypothetical protein M0802_013327 [Mischocyttarus mexicanus]|nr:hypothetical protein M0802_013330 [Mischocyttarus mexicanus]KAI4483502.1 hypothetical protein M0802_013327 [Mischocyttarus mexicanus]